VRGGVGALPDVPDDLREGVSLHHQLIVFLYGARSQRAANLGDGDGDGDLDENGVLTRGDGERKVPRGLTSSTSAGLSFSAMTVHRSCFT
jgi:hypothetical protein